MDKLKPEGDLIPDPRDRQSGRSRNLDNFDNEPQLNVDGIDIDADDRRGPKAKSVRDDEYEETYATDESMAAEPRPSRGRKKVSRQKAPLTRQYLMMGTGIIVLLLLIFGIGSALKAPAPGTDAANPSSSTEKSIDLSAAHENHATSAEPTRVSQSQDISLPPISSTPTQGQQVSPPEGQQRVELQGDLGHSLTQQQSQIDSAVTRSTLPMEPATVASVAVSKVAEPRSERKTAVIEPVQKVATRSAAKTNMNTESKPTPVKRNEPTHVATAPTRPAPVVQSPVAKAPVVQAPVVHAPVAQAKPAVPASSPVTQGHAQAIKSAPDSNYTLQLNASSSPANLNAWAKKENLQNYLVYQTARNGQPWYVLVSGVYATKADAERAVSSLPAGVQSNKPWTKPIHQVKSEIK